MSDTVKLIVAIPERILDTIQADEMISREQLSILQIHIQNGIPLNDVKAEIANINTFERAGCWVMKDVFKVLDNIGKAESEDKE